MGEDEQCSCSRVQVISITTPASYYNNNSYYYTLNYNCNNHATVHVTIKS